MTRHIKLAAIGASILAVVLTLWVIRAVPAPRPLVLLVSIDGFKPAYLHRGNSPTLDAMAQAGATAKGLVPSFPSVTFPNHYSIVTGLVPDHHGIVNNRMQDATVPGPPFALGSRDALARPEWWSEGIPIWVTLKRNGKRTSTLFWPGSETLIHGVQPDDWLPYDDTLTSIARVDKLLTWLGRSTDERADFGTLYFSEVDTAGHRFGPVAPEVGEAVKRVDDAMARLLAGLERLGLRRATDIIVVSDHGMTEVSPKQVIDLTKVLSGIPSATIRWIGPLAGISIDAGERDAALERLAAQENLSCWPKGAIPERFRFGTHRRVPDVVCLARLGSTVVDNPLRPFVRGQHGYDPAEPDMWGIFFASGPRIYKQQLGLVANVDVYLLLCRLLGVQPERNDASERLAVSVVKLTPVLPRR